MPYTSRTAVVAALTLLVAMPVAARPPNLVLMVVDDMGWSDAGCYRTALFGEHAASGGSRDYYSTPRIDHLAAEGVRFTDAYAQPLCSPTRASLLTGKHCARLGMTDWIPGFPNPTDSSLGHVVQTRALPLDEATIAEALAEHGYVTGMIGKWHVGHTPAEQGFQDVMEWKLGDRADRFDAAGRFMADRKGDAALRFIEEHRSEPFFLYLAFHSVHIPLAAAPEKIARYEGRAPNPVYAAMLEHVDDNVGRVLDRLEELGLKEETVVVFYSDNGGVTRHSASPDLHTLNFPLRANKGTLYEGGVRVPLIVSWPGVVSPGTISSALVGPMDLYPTLLELAGLQLRPDQHVDGVSFVGALRGGAGQRDELFWHYPHYSRHLLGYPSSAVRQGDWKLIEWLEDGRTELYNLREDIGEQNDLAPFFPERRDQLLGELSTWRERAGVMMPDRK